MARHSAMMYRSANHHLQIISSMLVCCASKAWVGVSHACLLVWPLFLAETLHWQSSVTSGDPKGQQQQQQQRIWLELDAARKQLAAVSAKWRSEVNYLLRFLAARKNAVSDDEDLEALLGALDMNGYCQRAAGLAPWANRATGGMMAEE